MIVNITAVRGPHIHAATALSVRPGRLTVTSSLVGLVGAAADVRKRIRFRAALPDVKGDVLGSLR
jgi:hypothetical protein